MEGATMSDPNKELLQELMSLTISELVNQIKSGEANPSTLNVARQLLKDNQITCSVSENTPLSQLVDILPFDEYAESDTREAKGL